MAERHMSLEEHVTCSICMDLYRDPLALPCMHSFCRKCLQGIFASSMSLKCPECRIDIKLGKKGIDGLAKNFQLASIVSTYQDEWNKTQTYQSHTRLPLCAIHRLACELQCKNCKTPICLKCITDGQHLTHTFTLLDDKEDESDPDIEVYCDKHSRQYKMYCTTCQSLVCLNCMVAKDHSKHAFSAIDSAYEHRKVLLEGRLKEFEKQQKIVRSNWKSYRDLTQKTQTDAQRKKEELTGYFKRLKDILERKEADLKLELENRENRTIEDCKRRINTLQATDKKLNSAIDHIKQLLTEERLQLLNVKSSKYERQLMFLTEKSESEFKPSVMPSVFDNVSLVTCQFEKEVRDIKWEWPKQVFELPQNVLPTAPPAESTQPIPLPRRRPSQKENQYSKQQYFQQQQYYPQQQEQQPCLQIGSLVQRGKHWKSGMEDGGPGHFGTVTQTTVDPHIYMVRWPNGKSENYTYNPPWKEEITPP